MQCPVLALNGSKIPVQATRTWMHFKGSQGRKMQNYTIKKMDGLNHLFQKCKTGDGLEYGSIEETINPRFLRL